MRKDLAIEGSNLTSMPRGGNKQARPDHKLSNSDKRKPKSDWDIFPRHGVYPAMKRSDSSSEPPNNGFQTSKSTLFVQEGCKG